MARSVNESANAQRRKKILEAAQRLIYTKGYEAMSIQDLLDDLRISKGAFYHYFSSKQDLLEAFVERMAEESMSAVTPFADDPDLPAIVKFEKVMTAGMEWKTDRKDMLISLMRSWYGDENILVRHKANAAGQRMLSPLIGGIVRQGVNEGVVNTPNPAYAASLFLVLGLSLSETIVTMMLDPKPPVDAYERIMEAANAYSGIYERILGAPAGSIHLVDPDLMKRWFAG